MVYDAKAVKEAKRKSDLQQAIVDALREKGPMSQSQPVNMVTGKKTEVIDAAKGLAAGNLFGVTSEPYGQSIRCSISGCDEPESYGGTPGTGCKSRTGPNQFQMIWELVHR